MKLTVRSVERAFINAQKVGRDYACQLARAVMKQNKGIEKFVIDGSGYDFIDNEGVALTYHEIQELRGVSRLLEFLQDWGDLLDLYSCAPYSVTREK